jgi:hypothetical protein
VKPSGAPKAAVLRVSYSAPSILRVGMLPTEGGEVTLLGENLGTTEDAVKGLLRVLFDGTPATSVEVTQDHKKIKCVAPPGVGTSMVTVTLDGATSVADALRAAPEVLALSPPDLDIGGGTLDITGLNFGDDVGSISVLLPDVGGEALSVELVEPHRRLRVLMPPMPPGVEPGAPLRMRVAIAGLHAIIPTDLVYSPPGGVPATATRPAYVCRRVVVAHSAKEKTPLASLFSSTLPHEPQSAAAGSAASPGSPRGVKGAAARAEAVARHSPVVHGSLHGDGPALSVTPQNKWQPDTPACSLCAADFGLSRRRHHCRVCGVCVCAACSPHELRLLPSAPPVRVCVRCNVRVGLLSQMTSVLDSIEALKKSLGRESDLFAFFRHEAIACISAHPHTPHAEGKKKGGGAAAGAVAGSAGGSAGTPATPKGTVRKTVTIADGPPRPATPGAATGATTPAAAVKQAAPSSAASVRQAAATDVTTPRREAAATPAPSASAAATSVASPSGAVPRHRAMMANATPATVAATPSVASPSAASPAPATSGASPTASGSVPRHRAMLAAAEAT